MTKPANLKPGDRLEAQGISTPTVVKVYNVVDPGDWVQVDIEPDRDTDIWDMAVLARSLGAVEAQWLSNTPSWRYRLYFDPEADLTVVRGEAFQ